MCIFVCLYACMYNAGIDVKVFFQGSVCFFFISSIISYVPIRMFVRTYVSLYNVWMILLSSVCNCICFVLFCLHVCSVCADKQKKSMFFLYVLQTECTCTNFVSSYERVYVAIYATLVCIDVYILHVYYTRYNRTFT